MYRRNRTGLCKKTSVSGVIIFGKFWTENKLDRILVVTHWLESTLRDLAGRFPAPNHLPLYDWNPAPVDTYKNKNRRFSISTRACLWTVSLASWAFCIDSLRIHIIFIYIYITQQLPGLEWTPHVNHRVNVCLPIPRLHCRYWTLEKMDESQLKNSGFIIFRSI